MTRIFPVESHSIDLTFKLPWEESLQLVGELLPLIQINLRTIKSVLICQLNQGGFQFSQTRYQHMWFLMIKFVTVEHLLRARCKTFSFEVKNVALRADTDSLFVDNSYLR